MSAVVFGEIGYIDMLAALIDGLVSTCHLYTNDPDLTPARVAADFVAPVYVGYSPVSIRYWTPPALRQGRAFSVTDQLIFQWTSGATPAPIRGYYVVETASGRLLWAWRRPGDAFALGPANPSLAILATMYFPSSV